MNSAAVGGGLSADFRQQDGRGRVHDGGGDSAGRQQDKQGLVASH